MTAAADSALADRVRALTVRTGIYPLVRALGILPAELRAVAPAGSPISDYTDAPRTVIVDAILARDAGQVAAALASLPLTGLPPARATERNGAVPDDATAKLAQLRALLAGGAAELDETRVRSIAVDVAEAVAKEALDSVDAKLAALTLPRTIIVQRQDAAPVHVGVQHERFPLLLAACSSRMPDGHRVNVWLAGPAGTGKTSAAHAVATALGLVFRFTGAIETKYDLFGFIDAGGRLTRTQFREAWEHGGVFLFDEVDASHPSAVVAFNAALANGVCAFPDAMIQRHVDCVTIAAANTFGHGGDSQTAGRIRQDGPFLDRFVFLEWPLDETLEAALCQDKDWLATVRALRAAAAARGVRATITPRASLRGAVLLAAGFSRLQAAEATCRNGMALDSWTAILADAGIR